MIKDIEFESEGATLRGLLFLPEDQHEKPPIIVMAIGTSVTIRMVADKYAEEFCKQGLAVLLYEHRNFGISDGEPRQQINPWLQCRGYLSAIDFAAQCQEVDTSKIGLWGSSYTGGEVIAIGAIDERVKAIVAQCPVCGEKPPAIPPNAENFERFRDILLEGDISGTPETTVGPIPVVSFDQASTPSILQPIQAFRWFIDYGGRPGTRWVNSVTRVIPDTDVPYSPVLCAPFVKAPTLMMVAPEDEMVHANYDVAKLTCDLMPVPTEWHEVEDGHFGMLYYPSERFSEACRIQSAFFRKWLLGNDSPMSEAKA